MLVVGMMSRAEKEREPSDPCTGRPPAPSAPSRRPARGDLPPWECSQIGPTRLGDPHLRPRDLVQGEKGMPGGKEPHMCLKKKSTEKKTHRTETKKTTPPVFSRLNRYAQSTLRHLSSKVRPEGSLLSVASVTAPSCGAAAAGAEASRGILRREYGADVTLLRGDLASSPARGVRMVLVALGGEDGVSAAPPSGTEPSSSWAPLSSCPCSAGADADSKKEGVGWSKSGKRVSHRCEANQRRPTHEKEKQKKASH